MPGSWNREAGVSSLLLEANDSLLPEVLEVEEKICHIEPRLALFERCKAKAVQIGKEPKKRRNNLLLHLQRTAIETIPKVHNKGDLLPHRYEHIKPLLEIFVTERQHPYILQLAEYRFVEDDDLVYLFEVTILTSLI